MEPLHQGLEHFKCGLFVIENHEQEANDEVHPLAILNLRVVEGIRLQDPHKDLGVYPWHVVHTPLHVEHDDLLDIQDQVRGLHDFGFERSVVTCVLLDLHQNAPNSDSLLLQALRLAQEQGLLQNVVLKSPVTLPVESEQLDQVPVLGYEFQSQTHSKQAAVLVASLLFFKFGHHLQVSARDDVLQAYLQGLQFRQKQVRP